MNRHAGDPIIAPADATLPSPPVRQAWPMLRAYLAECAREKEEASRRRTEELNALIRACAERLAVDRHGGSRSRDSRPGLEALDHAIRYVDEHLEAALGRRDAGRGARMEAYRPRRIALASALARYPSIVRSLSARIDTVARSFA